MKSRIAEALKLKHAPVALVWADEAPENAMQFKEDKWGCVMWLVSAAVKGRTAAADRKTFGCFGGGVGLGFGNQYLNFPGGEEGFCRFLSSGNVETEEGRRVAEQIQPFMREEAHDNFLHGERYVKTPDKVRGFIENLPVRDIPAAYVLFKPLDAVDREGENLRTVVFFADADQLSALVVLANYGRGDNENVTIPYAAGCQNLGIYPYQEAERERPRAVVGLTDISARLYARKQLGDGLLTFAAPLSLFDEMEGNVEGSFLERHTWRELVREKEAGQA
jgi:uncharacterized protein (DUF169 family)